MKYSLKKLSIEHSIESNYFVIANGSRIATKQNDPTFEREVIIKFRRVGN